MADETSIAGYFTYPIRAGGLTMKWAMRILAFLSVAFLGAAGFVYFTNRGDGFSDATKPPFEVGQTDFVLADIEPGEHEIIVTLTNTATVPRHILGFEEG